VCAVFRLRRRVVLLITTVVLLAGAVIAAAALQTRGPSPDLPAFLGDVDSAQYIQLRDAYLARLRGLQAGFPADPRWRQRSVQALQREQRVRGPFTPPVWMPIGPSSVANGQALNGTDTKVSGRVTAIAVDPTDSNTVYLGTAQGGVWRTTDGGTNWTPLLDSGLTLAVGSLAVAPSSPTTLYVGTGEPNLSCDSFFGVGLYRIDNAKTSATLVGPLNKDGSATDVFSGAAISGLAVDPTNAAIVFASTKQALGGIGCSFGPIVPLGVYRSTNATAAANAVTFSRLAVQPTAQRNVNAIALVNGDPNTLLVSVLANPTGTDGGIWRTTNALAPTPTFTRTATIATDNTSFAVSGNTVVMANDESGAGQVRESTDGGANWSTVMTAATGFCGGQCFYDLPVGIDPRTSGSTLRIYLGGSAGIGGASGGMKVSNDNGATFSFDQNGLHADGHAIAMNGATNPTTVWFGNDGGIWKRAANAPADFPWTNENNNLPTLQFQSVAVAKTDPSFTLGGTQDNGTELQQPSLGMWSQVDTGDGGYALIDQSTKSTAAVNMYHTYFNQTGSFIGFARVTNSANATKGGWSFLGCIGGVSNNGLDCSDIVQFYAPMALGPGLPNTLYFGTDRLYRSTDGGSSMSLVSQGPIVPNVPISSIGISPQTDRIRLVGLQNGQVWATTSGSSTLTNITPAGGFPANLTGGSKFIARVVPDPNDRNTAYATLGYYAGAYQGIWKTTDLGSPTPTWTAAANGLPNVPVDAFVVDPNNSNHLFAGTDIGVFASTDGGASWFGYGTGLPIVAVFDMAITQPGTTSEQLRIATHGRSMWQIMVPGGTTAVSVASFTASRTSAGVALSWRTGTEAAIAAFDVYRNGVRLNPVAIAARRAGQARGAAYRFLDRTHRAGTYRLRVTSLNGARTWSATIRPL
jgi:hypothetical protein